jgi:hypothetical protein
MVDIHPDRAVGLHLNFCMVEPYEGAPPTEAELFAADVATFFRNHSAAT